MISAALHPYLNVLYSAYNIMLGRLKSFWHGDIKPTLERDSSRNTVEQDDFLIQMADALCRLGLRLPALIALEAGHPFAFVGGQVLWITQPVLGLFLPTSKVRQAAHLLEDQEAVARLISILEAREG